jgi:hypothetical protein
MGLQSLFSWLNIHPCPELLGVFLGAMMIDQADIDEWRWRQILTRRIHPDDQPPIKDEQDEIPQNDE